MAWDTALPTMLALLGQNGVDARARQNKRATY